MGFEGSSVAVWLVLALILMGVGGVPAFLLTMVICIAWECKKKRAVSPKTNRPSQTG